MVHANFSALDAGVVEVWHGRHAITARVVWREGARAGLKAEDRIPVEDILTATQSQALQVRAGGPAVERRRRPRKHEDSRIRARAFEFASVGIVAVALALSFSLWVSTALAVPLAGIRTALMSANR